VAESTQVTSAPLHHSTVPLQKHSTHAMLSGLDPVVGLSICTEKCLLADYTQKPEALTEYTSALRCADAERAAIGVAGAGTSTRRDRGGRRRRCRRRCGWGHALPVLADLPPRTAGGTTVTGTGAIGVLGTTNGLGATRTGRATGVAQAPVVDGIRCTLGRRGRIAAKDGVAEVGAGAVVGQGQAGKQPGQGRAAQNASDAPQGLAARGRGRNGFGHLVKNT
jgi:hypothetical protein